MIRLPFFKPISLRFCPSSPVRLRLSSPSSPASSPLALPGVAAVVADGAGVGGGAAGPAGSATPGWPGDDGAATGCRLEGAPVATPRALSPLETAPYASCLIGTEGTATTGGRL